MKFESDMEKHFLQWLYVRVGISIHDCYRGLKLSYDHQKRKKLDPECTSNGPSQIAHAFSFLTAAMTLAYLMTILSALDVTLLQS